MKLFGNSKNGKHTSGGAQPHDRGEYREAEEASVSPEPVRKEPPRREPTMVPERPAAPHKSRQEEDVFNSIVQAVGAEHQTPQTPPEPPETPPVKRPEPPRPPEPVELFPDMEPDEEPEERKGMTKGKKALIAVGSVLGVLLLIAVAAIVVLKLWIQPPSPDNDGLNSPVPTASMENPPDDDNPPSTGPTTGRKENNHTFAIAGVDVASGNTDVILVGKLDTKEGTLNVVSIPRDTLINYGTYKINNAYAIGQNNGTGGVDNLKKELKKLMGFEIDSYAVVDTKAVEEIIDAIGGVYFDVPQNMVYNDPYQNLDINISKGYQLLSGADAVKVLRFRNGYVGGDIQRIGVQQDFFKAIAKQLLDLKNIPNMNAAIEIYDKRVVTNLDKGNVAWYLTQFLKLDFDNIQFMTLPGNTGGEINGGSYVFIYVDEWLEMVNEYLNPFYDQVTENHVSIKTSVNGTSFVYTAGANQ